MAKFGATGVRSYNRAALARVRAALDGVSEDAIKAADRRAVSSVRRRFEPVAKRAIREVYNVPAKRLAGAFRVLTGADERGEFMELAASRRKVPLIDFMGRWRGPARRRSGAWAPSATAAIVRSAGRTTYDSAFIATSQGRREIFVRQYSNDSRAASGRHPRDKIRALRGPSPYQMVRGLEDGNAERISQQMNDYRLSEIKRQLELARRRTR